MGMYSTRTKTPKFIITLLWWLVTLHFELPGRQGHHSVKIENFTFGKDNNGTNYIIYSESMTRTRQNGLHQKGHLQHQKLFEMNHRQFSLKYLKTIFQNNLSIWKILDHFTCNQSLIRQLTFSVNVFQWGSTL